MEKQLQLCFCPSEQRWGDVKALKSWRGSIHFSKKWCLEEHEGEGILAYSGDEEALFILAHN